MSALPLGISVDPDAIVPRDHRLIDVERIVGFSRLGFDALAEGLRTWDLHRRAGIDVDASGALAEGQRVVLRPRRGLAGLARLSGACTVVAVVDGRDADGVLESGVAYRTLPGHPEDGEQSVIVRYDGDTVRVRVRSVSRPGSRITRIAGPVARSEQDRIVGRYLDAARDLAR